MNIKQNINKVRLLVKTKSFLVSFLDNFEFIFTVFYHDLCLIQNIIIHYMYY